MGVRLLSIGIASYSPAPPPEAACDLLRRLSLRKSGIVLDLRWIASPTPANEPMALRAASRAEERREGIPADRPPGVKGSPGIIEDLGLRHH
jgi:hypothetical protein